LSGLREPLPAEIDGGAAVGLNDQDSCPTVIPEILALFDRVRIQDDAIRDWFRAVLASQTRDQQHETRSQRDELQRQLSSGVGATGHR